MGWGVKLVLLNGPPGAGKDTAGNALAAVFQPSRVIKFAETLKRATHDLYGLSSDTPLDAFEHCKDQASELFNGMTPREAYIDVSERVIKPCYGNDWLGRMILRRIERARRDGVRYVFATDSGFAAEARPAIEALGPREVLLIRVHAEGRGKSFDGDSRSYLDLSALGVRTVDLRNDSADRPRPFIDAAVAAVIAFLGASK